MKDLYIALIHYPVVNRLGERVVSSVTNLDLHDIARSAKTYGVSGYYVLHPSMDQQVLNQRILEYWKFEEGQPDRANALSLVRLVRSFHEIWRDIEGITGQRPRLWGTSAQSSSTGSSWEKLFHSWEEHPVLLLFGTASGLAPEWEEHLDGYLEPIRGLGSYNHLSVRSAAAIYLDRLHQGCHR